MIHTRLSRLLFGSSILLSSVVGFTVLSPTPFTISCTVMTAACWIITFSSWYIVHRNTKGA